MSAAKNLRLYAVIVAYFPEEHALSSLVRSLVSQGCKGVVVFQNSLLSSAFMDEHSDACTFLGEGENLGLGTAINLSFDHLKSKGRMLFSPLIRTPVFMKTLFSICVPCTKA